MTDVHVTIDGMHCAGCKNRVQEGLSRVEGVRSVDVDHEAGTAKVRFVAGQEDTQRLEETVEKLGYEVVGIQKG